jgi:hypothetical protein
MPESLQELRVANDEIVHADHMPTALTAGRLMFGDGATQVFTLDGHTTYTDRGRPTQGDWWVLGDGRFESFWPPDYKATYVLRWVVENGAITGLTFTEAERGTRFEGRYI